MITRNAVGAACLALLFCVGAAAARAADAPAQGDAAHHEPADAGGHHEEGHGGGLKLLPASADLPLWTLITFAIFVGLLTKFAWGPLRDALDQREAKIRQDIAAAEANRLKSESLLREYDARLAKVQDEVKEILAEARRDADYAKQEIVAAAQREAEATRQRAVADIERARDVALNELFDFVSSNVTQATERVLQRSLTPADQERLVGEALAEMQLRRN